MKWIHETETAVIAGVQVRKGSEFRDEDVDPRVLKLWSKLGYIDCTIAVDGNSDASVAIASLIEENDLLKEKLDLSTNGDVVIAELKVENDTLEAENELLKADLAKATATVSELKAKTGKAGKSANTDADPLSPAGAQ